MDEPVALGAACWLRLMAWMRDNRNGGDVLALPVRVGQEPDFAHLVVVPAGPGGRVDAVAVHEKARSALADFSAGNDRACALGVDRPWRIRVPAAREGGKLFQSIPRADPWSLMDGPRLRALAGSLGTAGLDESGREKLARWMNIALSTKVEVL